MLALVKWKHMRARPAFVQTAVHSIDSRVVSKCLTLPEKLETQQLTHAQVRSLSSFRQHTVTCPIMSCTPL